MLAAPQNEFAAMPDINPEKVCKIAFRARAVHAKVAPEEMDQGSNAIDDCIRSILEDYPDDASFETFIGELHSLANDELTELLAIAWVGRGVYDAGQWPEAMMEVEGMSRDEICRVLIATPLLSDYLESGIEAFGRSCQEFEPD